MLILVDEQTLLGGCHCECAPAVFADEVATRVTSLAVAGVVAVDVATLADAGMVTVGVADLADAGMAFPADLARVVAADVTTLADAGLVTVGITNLADAGMAFATDPAGAVTVGVTGLADGVDVLECSGGDVRWDDRMLPENWYCTGTPIVQDGDCQFVNYVGCATMEVSCVAAECSGSLSTCLFDQLCPVVKYMTCWEKIEAMSDDSYDSYEGADGQPGDFDYDDPRDYEEWCAWNDVDEDEGYYAPFPPNVKDGNFFSEVVVIDSVVYEPSKEEMPVSEGPDLDTHDDCGTC